ncbi:hypothetical protein [Allonocardiopsis opalescens]|uniref:DUF8129 domain-containing protein n=1 Tax=Allonocardiopsis opalescens TaxID=1144618 RepID=A0A2T0PYY0_9ACTN|nr:hypothetical protein [Allonocardiopsis opalescens]PRX96730.1 hypothetical protein CLV72_107253 [Allonocardiopsis opalescens]
MARERATLPIADYEHLPVGSLQHRIRSLSEDQLRALIDHEEAHARRTRVLEIMTRRLAELEQGAEPSDGVHERHLEAPPPPAGGSPVTDASAGPPVNPPPHGVPAQPGRPKGDRRG